MPTLHVDTDCPICGSAASLLGHSLVAPFLSQLSRLDLGQPSTYRNCDTCDLTFFDLRYGDNEMSSLYGAYRSQQYLDIRHHWEPWYSRNVNDAYSIDAALVENRRDFMMSILQHSPLGSTIDCAIDFGGDEGQFFPDISISRRVVCDVSNRQLPPGIEHIFSLDELGHTKANLIIVAHVLEHLSDPLTPLEDIRRVIADDGIVYVEVPLDRFRVHPFHASTRYKRFLQWLAHHRLFLIVLDFLTGMSRQFSLAIPRFGVIKQSEHINYFSGRSLRALLAASGFLVIAERSDSKMKVGGLRIGSYGVAAMPDLEMTS